LNLFNLKELFSSKSFRFIFLFLTGIVVWFSFYHFIYELDEILSSSSYKVDIKKSISILLAKQSNFLLSLFGYQPQIEIYSDMVVTLIQDGNYNHGVWIGEPCNGLKLFGVFSIFIIAFPGSLKTKLWYIPLGIIILHFINVIRIAILTIIQAYNPMILNFNHNVTFQVIIYSFIFLLWYFWTKKFSSLSNKYE
jgi:exosortase family protein XrtF